MNACAGCGGSADGAAQPGVGPFSMTKLGPCVCVCIVCHLVDCVCEEALAERVAEESRRDEWAAEASQGERAQLAWGGGL